MVYHHRKRYMPCATCGTRVLHSPIAKKPPRCLQCGIDAFKKANDEMHNKNGAAYNKWLAGMQKFAVDNPPGSDPSSQHRD
jgi:DNA-directed RNA polymerase subunit RPC12/RpoP